MSAANKPATRDTRKYGQYIVWPFLAVARLFIECCRFLDDHHGAVGAVATSAICVLPFFYVTYSKRQWKTMDKTLGVIKEQDRPYIGIKSIDFHGVKPGSGKTVTVPMPKGMKACVYGTVRYKDIRKGDHSTIFCAFAVPESGNTTACPYHNDMN